MQRNAKVYRKKGKQQSTFLAGFVFKRLYCPICFCKYKIVTVKQNCKEQELKIKILFGECTTPLSA